MNYILIILIVLLTSCSGDSKSKSIWQDSDSSLTVVFENLDPDSCDSPYNKYHFPAEKLTSERLERIDSFTNTRSLKASCSRENRILYIEVENSQGEIRRYMGDDSVCDDTEFSRIINSELVESFLESTKPKKINESQYYVDDIQTFYWSSLELSNVDANSFTPLASDQGSYAKDDYKVWFKDTELEVTDPSSFIILDDLYSSDRSKVFYLAKALEGAAYESFAILTGGYARDNSSVFYQEQKVVGADPSKFSVIQQSYGSDQSSIFLKATLLENADPASFEILSDGYSKDATQVWYHQTLIEGADPTTFQVTGCRDEPVASLLCSPILPAVVVNPLYCFAKDENREYINGEVVQ